jgi:hypothetical protein
VRSPWCQLGNVGLFRGGFTQDTTGAFGYNLVAVTDWGYVFIVSPGDTTCSSFKQLAYIPTHLEGVEIVPNIPSWGPLAGKVLIGAEQASRIYVVSPEGGVSFYNGPPVEDIDFIPANENFFGINYAQNRVRKHSL